MAMLVPRSFGFKSVQGPPGKDVDPEKCDPKTPTKEPQSTRRTGHGSDWRGFGWRPDSFQKPRSETIQAENKNKTDINALTRWQDSLGADVTANDTQPPSKMSHIVPHDSLPSRSTPVAVPLRSQPKRTASGPPPNDARMRRTSLSSQTSLQQQDARQMPRSVASILASTSIPKKKQFPRPRSTPRRMSTQQLMDEWRSNDAHEGSPMSSSPTMDFLLTPLQDDDFLARSDSFESFGDISSRSLSSDSIPSLEVDENSMLSWSSPSTPSTASQKTRKGKAYSLPKKLDQTLDHPLSPSSSGDNLKAEEEEEEEDDSSSFRLDTPRASQSPSEATTSMFRPALGARKPSAFKSNLTASLNSLRNSIRSSLSNFSAPTFYALPEDHLSRGLFSNSGLPYRSEMRPRPLDGPPTPELRRYLNPSQYHFRSPGQELHHHGQGRIIDYFDYEAAVAQSISPSVVDEATPTLAHRGAIIPLQPYVRPLSSPAVPSSSLSPSRGNSTGSLTEAGRTHISSDGHQEPQYRRELRENGEFLRVCVLEMNMRRAGKFSDGIGKARVWLPPREGVFLSANEELSIARAGRDVPRRWVGVVSD